MPITDNDIREGLSYAYFHAIASRAGFACQPTARTIDAMAVDAIVVANGKLAPDSQLTKVTAEFQLKATSAPLPFNDGKYSFRVDRDQYDKLRAKDGVHAITLVVLMLPEDDVEWLRHDEDGLICKRCAYWVSLRDAQPSTAHKPTIYIPKQNVFSGASLRTILTRFSRFEEVNYGE